MTERAASLTGPLDGTKGIHLLASNSLPLIHLMANHGMQRHRCPVRRAYLLQVMCVKMKPFGEEPVSACQRSRCGDAHVPRQQILPRIGSRCLSSIRRRARHAVHPREQKARRSLTLKPAQRVAFWARKSPALRTISGSLDLERGKPPKTNRSRTRRSACCPVTASILRGAAKPRQSTFAVPGPKRELAP